MTTDRELLEMAAKAAGKRERHGMDRTPEHCAWVSMKQRCTNPKKREYERAAGLFNLSERQPWTIRN